VQFTVPSFAKINWSLRVLGKREDGYHEIHTVLQTVSLHDVLHFQRDADPQVKLICNDPQVPADHTNLIMLAAQLLQARFNPNAGATIRLEKKIPAGGGLGGGSSNAAVTLLVLSQLWNLDLLLPEMINLGSQIGSDVPFFLVGGRAVATGVGSDITPVADCVETSLVIVTPRTAVSTAKAYEALNSAALTSPNSALILTSSRSEADLSLCDQWPLHNDFEKVIFEMEPEIKRVRKALLDAGAQNVLLAGSGSSVFGIFESAEAQHRALEAIKVEDGWRVFPCSTLSRDKYRQSLSPCETPLYAFP
jgi:4-diphosphocytidyl-2-C-methyl-D-erythritol kinase